MTNFDPKIPDSDKIWVNFERKMKDNLRENLPIRTEMDRNSIKYGQISLKNGAFRKQKHQICSKI